MEINRVLRIILNHSAEMELEREVKNVITVRVMVMMDIVL
jgi:hypothetical protein